MTEGEALGHACQRSDLNSEVKINPFCVPTLLSPLCSYSRDQPIFLQLKDYFWVKTPSAYELPYGTKGSGKCGLVLWEQWLHLGHGLLVLCYPQSQVPMFPAGLRFQSQRRRRQAGLLGVVEGERQPLECWPLSSAPANWFFL